MPRTLTDANPDFYWHGAFLKKNDLSDDSLQRSGRKIIIRMPDREVISAESIDAPSQPDRPGWKVRGAGLLASQNVFLHHASIEMGGRGHITERVASAPPVGSIGVGSVDEIDIVKRDLACLQLNVDRF